MSETPQAPDYAIRVFTGANRDRMPEADDVSYAPESNNPPENQLAEVRAQTTNLAKKDELVAGSTPVAGTAVAGSGQAMSAATAPATAVNVKDTNLLLVQNFNDASTVAVHGKWSWNAEEGNITPGSAQYECVGILDDLVSNEVPVVAGERVQVTVYVKWEGLVYTGSNPFMLGVEKYRQSKDAATSATIYVDVGGTDLIGVTSPGTSGGWKKLTGTYTVPSSGVDQVRARLRVKNTATSGYIYWDEIELKKLDLIPDAAVPGVGASVDNVAVNLGGRSGVGFSQADAADAYKNTANSLTAMNSQVAQLNAQNGTGAVAGDEFSWTGELGGSANWSAQYTNVGYGNYTADGGDAAWVNGTMASYQQAFYTWIGADTESTTDYQNVGVVLSSAIGYDTTASTGAILYLMARRNNDGSHMVYVAINGNGTYNLYKRVAGVDTVMKTGTVGAMPGAGGTINFYAGNKGTTDLHRFRLLINGGLVFDYTDPGASSSVGVLYRGWGFGGQATQAYTFIPTLVFIVVLSGYWYGPLWVQPPKINQWIGQDQ